MGDSTADHSHRWTASWTAALTRSKALMVSKLNSVEILCKDLNLSGWWLNQPIWKIFLKLDHETPRFGINMKNIWVATTLVIYSLEVFHMEVPRLKRQRRSHVESLWTFGKVCPPKRKGPVFFPMIFSVFFVKLTGVCFDPGRQCFLTSISTSFSFTWWKPLLQPSTLQMVWPSVPGKQPWLYIQSTLLKAPTQLREFEKYFNPYVYLKQVGFDLRPILESLPKKHTSIKIITTVGKPRNTPINS